MAVSIWTDEMDAALKRQRVEHKLPWRVVRIEGATLRECQKRLAFLTSGKTAAVVRVAKGGPREDEDGLDRLIRRGKLTPLQLEMAKRYRRVGRLAMEGGGSLRSCLDTSPGGGGGGAMPGPGEGFKVSAAKREFHLMRWVTLRGQVDVLTALDGVLLGGHTLLALAGGEGRGARAAELQVALTIGLDLLVAAALDGLKKVA